MKSTAESIKFDLENIYDIPFLVTYKLDGADPEYTIVPENALRELFEILIQIRQSIRLIINISPQRYAAEMVSEMNHASLEKRIMFRNYAELFREKGAKIEFVINNAEKNIDDDESWIDEWRDFQIRATKLLVEETEEQGIREDRIVSEWAMLSVGMMLSLLTIEQTDTQPEQYTEGRLRQVIETRHERNPVNRELCIAANGCRCRICGFDFEKEYGELGRGFIHVHHIEMISSHEKEYYLDPVKDLIPVCPNCHAMLHRSTPPLQPEELRRILSENKTQ